MKNKLNNKGFTLVELLAVVVILSVILLVATPAIGDLVDRTKDNAFKISVQMIGKNIDNTISILETKCDGTIYDIRDLEMQSIETLTGTWSCEINPDSSYKYTLNVNDGYRYVSVTSDNINEIIEILKIKGPILTLKHDLINEYQIGSSLTISSQDIIESDDVSVTFNVYENDALVVENMTEYVYNATHKTNLKIAYQATNSLGTTIKERDITISSAVLGSYLINQKVDAGDGLYEATTDIYRYKGNVLNNYVWYSGYMWRIVGVENNLVKLITEENVTAYPYGRHKVAGANYQGSYLQQWLNNIFGPSLNKRNDIVTDGVWCNDATSDITSSRLACTNSVTYYLGLPTLDEYNYSGGKGGYMNNTQTFHTMTPASNDYTIYAVSDTGDLVGNNGIYNVGTVNYFGVRPMVMLKSDIAFIKGNGTKTEPYMLELDDRAETSALLNTRYTGEYLLLDDRLWRIASKTSDGIKIVLNDYVRDNTGLVQTYMWQNPSNFSLANGQIGYNINTYVQENILGIQTKSMLVENVVWPRYKLMKTSDANGSPHHLPNILSEMFNPTYTVTSTIGMLNIGDLLVNQKTQSSPTYYWTFSINDDLDNDNFYNWYLNANGAALVADSSFTSLRTIRPVIMLNNEVKVISGEGTARYPYRLGN